jgi:hypothetical protein
MIGNTMRLGSGAGVAVHTHGREDGEGVSLAYLSGRMARGGSFRPHYRVDAFAHGGGCRKSSPPGQCCHMEKKTGQEVAKITATSTTSAVAIELTEFFGGTYQHDGSCGKLLSERRLSTLGRKATKLQCMHAIL